MHTETKIRDGHLDATGQDPNGQLSEIIPVIFRKNSQKKFEKVSNNALRIQQDIVNSLEKHPFGSTNSDRNTLDFLKTKGSQERPPKNHQVEALHTGPDGENVQATLQRNSNSENDNRHRGKGLFLAGSLSATVLPNREVSTTSGGSVNADTIPKDYDTGSSTTVDDLSLNLQSNIDSELSPAQQDRSRLHVDGLSATILPKSQTGSLSPTDRLASQFSTTEHGILSIPAMPKKKGRTWDVGQFNFFWNNKRILPTPTTVTDTESSWRTETHRLRHRRHIHPRGKHRHKVSWRA